MSNYWATADRVTPAAVLDYAEATPVVVFEPGKPAHVKRIILVGVEVGNGAEVITVAVRDAGDAGNSETIGTFTIPNGFAVDALAYVELAEPDPDGETIQASQDIVGASTTLYVTGGVIEVPVGKEISLTSTGGTATTGQANVYFEYSEQGQDLNGMTKLTFTHA